MSTQLKVRRAALSAQNPHTTRTKRDKSVIPADARFITVAQLANLLQKSHKTIYRRAKAGTYSYFRDDSGQILFYRNAVESHLAARSVGIAA